MNDPAEYYTALNELDRKVQESYERGCEDGQAFERQRMVPLIEKIKDMMIALDEVKSANDVHKDTKDLCVLVKRDCRVLLSIVLEEESK
jgi:hypothetical protein